VRNNLFDGLVQDGDPQNLPGALAETWDSADAKSWTFHLRQGVHFHDGVEVTSDIVKSSVERIQNPATKTAGALRTVAAEIAAVTAVDKYTVRIDLKAANGAFPLEMVDIKIVPPDFNVTKPVGTGPFQFVEWVRNQRITLKKNPNYFLKGLPYLEQVIFQPVPDENQKVVLLQAGQVDFSDTIPLPRVKDIQAGGKIVVQGIAPGMSPSSYFMELKTDTPPLNDVRVRQAINYAIDRRSQLDVTFGVGTIKSNPVPPKHWAFDPQATSYDQRDVNKAKQLLAQAGHSSGLNLQLKYITSRAEFATIAQLFQTSMADVGIKVDLVPQEINVWVNDVLNKHNFQLGLTGIIPNYDPDQIMRRYDPTDQDGAAMAWKDSQYLSLLDQGKALVMQDQRKPIYAQAQVIEQNGSAGLVLNERPILYGSLPSV
jgi:peptide/nickel transport system substrate-binding protein